MKTYIHTKASTWIVTAALFIIVRTWKQPKRPSAGEWIKKQWDSEPWIIQHYKEMTYQAMERHGGTLNAYYYMKEVREGLLL